VDPGELLTIVIPAYNEERSIAAVIDSIRSKKYPFVREIVVVDDGSVDRTFQLALESGARVIRHRRNSGNAQAIKTGIRASETEFVMVFDADGQHSAEDIPRLWERAAQNDMVVGMRKGLIHSKLWRMPGKWLLWIMASYLVGHHIPDLNSGLRVMRKSQVMKYIHLCPAGFSFHTTMTMVMFCRGYAVEYIPIRVSQRTGKSSVNAVTGLDTIVLILRMATLFNPLRIFLPLSCLLWLMGFLWGLPIVLARRGVSVGAVLSILTGMVFFAFGLIGDQVSQIRLEEFERVDAEQSVRENEIGSH
jgi:glycosyltransferase involved in cell wall biosynthesis